jgi:hypothetical protein
MIVEIRKYHALHGKLEEVKSWFADVGLKFFHEYRVEQVGFWTDSDNCNVLICMLRWNNLAERETKWTRLESDRLWQIEQAASTGLIRYIETTLLTTPLDQR